MNSCLSLLISLLHSFLSFLYSSLSFFLAISLFTCGHEVPAGLGIALVVVVVVGGGGVVVVVVVGGGQGIIMVDGFRNSYLETS